MAEIRVQMEEPAGELVPRSLLSRLKSSYICRNVVGALMLGLVAGLSAGGCMGVMAAVMVRLIRDIKINQTELTVKISNDPDYPSISTAHLTYLCLLVAIASSAVGVLCGHQAFNLVRRQRGGDMLGKALALAAPVAVLGVAVTGAALGAGLEVVLSSVASFIFSHGFCKTVFLWHIPILITVSVLLRVYEWFNRGFSVKGCFAFIPPVSILEFLAYSMWFDAALNMHQSVRRVVFLTDMASMTPIIVPSLFSYMALGEGRKVGKMPTLMSIMVLIARSLLHDTDHPVPLLEPAEFTPPVVYALQRIFVIVFVVQMFQVSCGADLFSYFVTGGAGKVGVGAVAATAGVLAALLGISSMLGTGASLGVLLAVSGGAGVALDAAGDLGHRYGGHAGRVGVVVGAAVGAFLPLAAQDVKFGIMVALCAAVIPGSYYMYCYYDILYFSICLLGGVLAGIGYAFINLVFIVGILLVLFILPYWIFGCLYGFAKC